MSTEIELKYLILDEDVSIKVFALLKNKQYLFSHQVKQLSNCYFDSADLALRKLDMGLRVRTCDQHTEQTIKTAGVVIGGLHQRPEYNIDIDFNFPELNLFPDHIWPENQDVNQLQHSLISLFNTDFTRETWLINIEGAVIELAFDQGIIEAAGRTTNICEIELELVSGDRTALFTLAKDLFAELSIRPGIKSKAARGYQLFFNQEKDDSSEVSLDILSEAKQINEHFNVGINYCLTQLQGALEQYLSSHSLVKLAELVDILALARQGFWLFEDKLTDELQNVRAELSYFIQLFAWVDSAIYLKELMNKTGNYRKKLEYSKQLIEQLKLEKRRFPDASMVSELLHSERFNNLQLSLLSLALNDEHQQIYISPEKQGSLSEFIKEKLSINLHLLTSGMLSTSLDDVEHYLSLRKLLHRSLLTGYWFGCFFEKTLRDSFRTPWQDIQIGLSELQSLWIIKTQLEKLDVNSDEHTKKILLWQQGKVESLLLAIEQSKTQATSATPYWVS